MAVYAYIRRLLGPFATYGQFGLQVEENLSAVDRVFEIFEIRPSIVDRENARELDHVQGEIALEQLHAQERRVADQPDDARAHSPLCHCVKDRNPDRAAEDSAQVKKWAAATPVRTKIPPSAYPITERR